MSTEPKWAGLRIHSPDDESHYSRPSTEDSGIAATLAALAGNSSARSQSYYSPAMMSPALDFSSQSPPVQPNQQATPEHNPASLLAPGGPMADIRPNNQKHASLFFGSTLQGPTNSDPAQLGAMPMADYGPDPRHIHDDGAYAQYPSQNYHDARASTMMDSQAYFSDFAGQQPYYHPSQPDDHGDQPPPPPDMAAYDQAAYRLQDRYSSTEPFSPTAAMAPPMLTSSDLPPPGALEYQMPLDPRGMPFTIFDSHNSDIPMSSFDNIAAVLRHRGHTTPKLPAYWVLDSRGKEIASITWDKLASRAEKVAQVIRDKSALYRGDRVALIYQDTEVIDFAIALMGCFLAGVVAVPINDLQDYRKLSHILTSTQAHLALTTDNNLKAFHRDITAQKLDWPKGVEWWKTNEFGSYHPKKKGEDPPLSVPDLAYIEFCRAPTGDVRGVALAHQTIMHQMGCLSAIISTVPKTGTPDTLEGSTLRDKNGRLISGSPKGEIMLSYLDPRQGIGMILGVLLTVYGGHTTVWLENKVVDVPGLYAHLITKYRATLMLADYPGLKRAAYNYQQDPMTTRNFKKGTEPNFQAVKLCLIDTLTVDTEFHELLADRWLRPLRNTRAREVVAPMLTLAEHGGMIISVRDWLGGEERMGCPLKPDMRSDPDSDDEKDKDDKDKATTAPPLAGSGFGSLLGRGTSTTTEQHAKNELSEVLLDREALKTNEVVIVAIGEEARKKAGSEPGTVRVGAFGCPIPDATLTVVDPETTLLARPNTIGEIWVDSPSLSGGFWALPKPTAQIFHARPYRFEPGDPTPTASDAEFLRTGLLGTVIEGKIFVLGLYEDRIRQQIEWVDQGHEVVGYLYFFVQHIIVSIMRNVPKIFDCTAFDVYVNDEHLPIILLESQAASTAPTTSGGPPRQLDMALLDSLAERCMDVLEHEHNMRVYCVMTTAPNALPRILKNGRREIGNMLCRREFEQGTLPCVHVKFSVENTVLNLPRGIDPVGGIWSPIASSSRAEILAHGDKQYSGIDRREVVIDDRTSTSLNNFSSITDLIQWRVARQPEELAYCTVDGRGKEGKGVTWRKFDTKIVAVALYLKNKVKIKPRDHVILMYTHSEEFVFAVHACISLGAVIIPLAPIDENRLSEDVPAFLHLVSDYSVKAVLVNQDADHLLKTKSVSQHIKQSAQVLKATVPYVYNTTKPPKQSHGLRDHGILMDPAWVQPGYPVIVWAYWTADQRRIAVQLGHDTIFGMCKVQKETCQMTSSRPVLGCVRSTSGLGFIHSCLMGIYIGTPTYLLSPLEFAQNPMSLFLTLSRYKVKDTYATPQMLDHAMAIMTAKGFTLHELKNMMISAEGRPRVDVFQKVRLHFAAPGLDRTAINTVYSHVLNPMIASRSYLCFEPIELWLDPRALRRGLVVPVDPEMVPRPLLVQDSGMVPVSTQIAIVNPESRMICHDGEYGEVWVYSEACVKSFYGSQDLFDAERFDGRIVDQPGTSYVRTGDLGFLHSVSRPIGPGGVQVDMQVLFVLGSIGDTIEINGLGHFPMDIENTVEACSKVVIPGGCAVFQAGGFLVVLAEAARKSHLASIVPVLVNSILNEHQIIVDIVAFVSKGDFPRSRLGEKQRGKILAGWVSRKMRTIAQFAIRDMDSAALGGELGPHDSVTMTDQRMSTYSARSMGGAPGQAYSMGHGSLRGHGSVPQMIKEVEPTSHEILPSIENHGEAVPQQQQQYPGGAIGLGPAGSSSGPHEHANPGGNGTAPPGPLGGGDGTADEIEYWTSDALRNLNLAGKLDQNGR